METTGTIFYKSTQILAYADDIDIIGPSFLPEAYQGIEQAGELRIADKRDKDQTNGGNISGPTNNSFEST